MSEKLTLREKLHIGEKRPDGEKPRMSKKLKKGIFALTKNLKKDINSIRHFLREKSNETKNNTQ